MPLTDRQKSKYFGRVDGWARVRHANDWNMVNGRLSPEAAKAEFSQWHGQVWAFAEVLARQNHRAITLDDLRHGAHWLALGTPKSSKALNNADFDRVLIVFKLLIDPNDIGTTPKNNPVADWIAFQQFEAAKREIARCRELRIPCAVALPDDPGERRRQLYFIGLKTPQYVMRIVRERFAGQLPEDMSLRDLRQLSMTLDNRTNAQPAPRPAPVVEKPTEVPDDMIPW